MLRVAVKDDLDLNPYTPTTVPDAAMIYAEVSNFTDKPRPIELNADSLIARLIRLFQGQVGDMQLILKVAFRASHMDDFKAWK
jgi:hypothetical protein